MKRIIGSLLLVTLLLSCATSKVNITSNVEGANIILDGKPLGQTPIYSATVPNVSGRSYEVVIEKEGYQPYRGFLRKESNTPALVAVIVGYSLIVFILPALLLFNYQYLERPVENQYFILEEIN